jgi:hypothetical protein
MVRHPRRRGGLEIVHPARADQPLIAHNSDSEIPCRASSDLHEWRNDLGTVSTGDSAKLHYE